METENLRAALRGLCAYKELLRQSVPACALRLLDALAAKDGEAAMDAYTDLFCALRREGYLSMGAWLWDALRFHESLFSALVERGGEDPALENSARRDVEVLLELAQISCERYLEAMRPLLGDHRTPVLAGLPRWGYLDTFRFEELTSFYRVHGGGLFARYRAFLWDGEGLIPVPTPDSPPEEELLGYELQRSQVAANTRALVEGRLCNDVLLFGDGGTGKSATVKSLLELEGMEPLRLVEISKTGLETLPRLIRSLAGRRQKFILFIDDLAFDQDDRTYSVLKTILEGGLERRPDNVAVYATSNRRHLVRQTFSDREGDEVDAFETIAEKTALAERFGLRIPYLSMRKGEYLSLVEHLAQRAGVKLSREELHAGAMRWELRHAGRTPRTARQFIASLGC